jgi:uncharacterized protein
MILIVIAMSVAFLIFSVYTPFKKKIPQRSSTSVTKTGPSFRKDGTLSIVTSNPTSKIMLDIEIADDEGERMRGLMDRLNLPENAGMLFIFNNDEPRSFWMKNTFIPLDIIFINSNKEIVSIQKDTQPKTTTPIPSDFPARYVLEVNTGFTDRYNIKPGDVIDFSH